LIKEMGVCLNLALDGGVRRNGKGSDKSERLDESDRSG